MLRVDDIKGMVSNPAIGQRGFVRIMADLLEGRYNGREVPKIGPDQWSFKTLFEGMVGPCEEHLPSMQTGARGFIDIQEAVDSTSFPSATGILINAKVIEGY